MPSLHLDRATLSSLLQGNQRAIFAFEKIFSTVDTALPSTIEEANALAGQALAAAQAALSALTLMTEAIQSLESAPAACPNVEPDDMAPRPHMGTMTGQNADAVQVTGGAVDNTPIGQTTAAAGSFTTVGATGQITSTVATGTPPFIVASRTQIPNLNPELLQDADWGSPKAIGNFTPNAGTFTTVKANGAFGCNGKAAQLSAALGAAATDAATTQTLVNTIRAALIANGIGA